jgi:formylglycine-generating enzyme
MTQLNEQTLRQKQWKEKIQSDEDLRNAWVNVTQMMYKGSIPALLGAAQLIAQMDWWDGLLEWLDFTNESTPTIASYIHLDERSLYAFVLLRCRSLALTGEDLTWFHLVDEEIFWGRVAVQSASLPTLSAVPEWLLEDVVLGCTNEINLPINDDMLLCIQQFPVTQALYEAITEKNPSAFLGQMHPVDTISWYDAVQFCNHLSEAMGFDPAYTIHQENVTLIERSNGFRLPTSSQWIMAARYGTETNTLYAGHAELWKVGLYASNTSDHIGRNLPTPTGIYDLSGNVWEWCWSENTQIDPLYAERKGGSWISREKACTVDFVSTRLKSFAESTQGMRLCRVEAMTPNTTMTTIETHHPEDGWEW